MLIELDLNANEAESLLRHYVAYKPALGDFREDSRLSKALEPLATAITDSMSAKHFGHQRMEMIDPRLLKAATNLFTDQAMAIGWLSRPLRALGDKRPLDVPIEQALTLIGRLEDGFGA